MTSGLGRVAADEDDVAVDVDGDIDPERVGDPKKARDVATARDATVDVATPCPPLGEGSGVRAR